MNSNYNSNRTNQFSIWKALFVTLVILLTCQDISAQVNVNPGAGSYTTLQAAFNAINLGTHTGVITVDIVGNTTEIASAVLNASGSGGANYTSIIISPSGGATRTVSGSLATPLIDLNGADNVTINGVNSGGNSLVVENQSTATTATTIRFINDASSNVIQNCTILGASTAITTATILFSTADATLLTGNDNNTIRNCNLDGSGANLSANAILCVGNAVASQENSNITVNGNNIANFFSATIVSSGVSVSAGGTDWAITNNKLYQSATRTYTTGNIHKGIRLASGDSHIISNNTIGFSNTSGTGVYTMAGTIATRFIAIDLAVTNVSVTSVQGNIISAISLATSSGATTTNGILCGINITSGDVNVGTISANTIGTISGIGSLIATSTTTGGFVVAINSSSTGIISIQNNLIGALVSSGSVAAVAGSITGINVSGVATSMTINNNTIGNTTTDNMRGGTSGLTTGSSLVSGINLVATPTSISVTSNIIRNMASYGTGTSGFVRGIQTAAVGSTTAIGWTISNNVVNNLVTNSTLINIASGLCSALGIHHLASQGVLISGNTISNISNINTTATTNIIVAGISSANATLVTALGATIIKNKIFGLSNSTIGTTTLAPPIVAGIVIRSGNNVVEVSNNMISLGNGQTTNTSFIGVWCQNGSAPNPTSINIYHNSVNIEGTAVAGALPSFAFMRSMYISATANTVTIDARNNIFQNNRSGGIGQHFAISNGFNSTVNATGWASNNNVLNANAATISHWTIALNFETWKTTAASDGYSLSGIPTTFVNAPLADLHLNMGITPTQLESGGATVSVLVDYDNQTRPGPTGSVNGGAFAPDFGADEFDGVYLDVVPPTITHTALPFTCDGSVNRILTASISDVSGVPTTGLGLPVLYWKINAGVWNSVTATYVSGSNYTFSFGAGAILGDTVSYYIVAQDNLAIVGASPSAGTSGFTINPPVATTPPTTPNTYMINGSLSGIYTVGATGNYPNLTEAINTFNTSCLTGAIVFELLDATYAEAGAMVINANPTSSAINTLTIRPATGVIAVVSASVTSGAVLKILNSYTVIDGSNNGTTTRDLTLTNTSVTSPSVIHIGSSGANAIINVTLKNTIIINGATTATAIVTSDGSVLGNEGYFNNITITNNDIQKAYIGSYSIAVFQAGNGNGLSVTNNLMNTVGANSLRRIGVYIQGVDGATVSGNNIGNFENVNAENDTAIWLATNSSNATVANNTIVNLGYTGVSGNAPIGISLTSNITFANLSIIGNTISGLSSGGGTTAVSTNGISLGSATGNVIISQNNISNIKNTNASGWGSHGILLGSTNLAANCLISNNFVQDIASTGFAGGTVDDNGYGISVNAGAGYNIYHNTVNMDANQTAVGGLPAAFLVTASVTTAGAVNVRNNIFKNSQTSGNTERYAIYSGAANTVFSSIDYNDYFTTGPNLGFIGSARATLANIITGFGQNTASVNIDPIFVSPTDLHLDTLLNPTLDNLGTPIATVTTDIDGAPRSGTTPDMGADEINFLSVNHFDIASGFKAYPNPVSNILNIEYTSELSNITIYNLLGQQVLTKNVNTSLIQIDMSELNAGTYLVKVSSDNISKTIKVVKK